jgi:hypothetical protein
LKKCQPLFQNIIFKPGRKADRDCHRKVEREFLLRFKIIHQTITATNVFLCALCGERKRFLGCGYPALEYHSTDLLPGKQFHSNGTTFTLLQKLYHGESIIIGKRGCDARVIQAVKSTILPR